MKIELKNKEVKITEFGEIKTYLKESEMIYIVELVKDIKDYFIREKIVNLFLIKFLTNYDVEEYEYDLMLSSGLIECVRETVNKYCLDSIYNAIDENLSWKNMIEEVLNKGIDKLPNTKEIKSILRNFTKKLEELKNG